MIPGPATKKYREEPGINQGVFRQVQGLHTVKSGTPV